MAINLKLEITKFFKIFTNSIFLVQPHIEDKKENIKKKKILISPKRTSEKSEKKNSKININPEDAQVEDTWNDKEIFILKDKVYGNSPTPNPKKNDKKENREPIPAKTESHKITTDDEKKKIPTTDIENYKKKQQLLDRDQSIYKQTEKKLLDRWRFLSWWEVLVLRILSFIPAWLIKILIYSIIITLDKNFYLDLNELSHEKLASIFLNLLTSKVIWIFSGVGMVFLIINQINFMLLTYYDKISNSSMQNYRAENNRWVRIIRAGRWVVRSGISFPRTAAVIDRYLLRPSYNFIRQRIVIEGILTFLRRMFR